MSPSARLSGVAEDSVLEPIAICGMACRLPGDIDNDSSFWKTLVEKRTGQTPKVPKSRFNIDAHYHNNLERPGSFNVAGGYFLNGKVEDFDPSFFNMTPIEAQWLDPQQRKMLEVSYESLVSAGLTLDEVSGSNTAVFVGSFTADYQQISTKDPDFRHNYVATGVDPGIISNRIGNTFNLNGPSFTINTACSSSVYAIHNACHALRARDCDAAIAGGVNLIVTVDQHMNTAKLGILSPTSTCHTFDSSADGYGRAEGAGAMYLKRLADAIRDCDPIRGVIRSSAVNTNGKVEGMGITHPSVKGQERVVRMAYEKANLDPSLTAYAELHGTGTPVGDPIEVRAISSAMNDTRPKNRPLLIGAVKPNIGHSEAASGIFAVMKAALMTEAATIPGVALFKELNREILEDEWNVKVQANTVPWPQKSALRRASVSSFGYGGTNGHVIIESVDSLYPWYQHGRRKNEAKYDHSSKQPFLVCFSAHDKKTLSRNIQAIQAVVADYYVADIAHTLNLHRTKFSHRAFALMRENQEIESLSDASVRYGTVSKQHGGVGFLFTGQGAQWTSMGIVALLRFPIFKDTIEKLDSILKRINPTPTFRIADMLMDDTVRIAARVNDAEVAQPLCTAIQIALVELFSQWGIVPQVSVGHSSGEIAAAFAAGLVSAPEAIITAFCRGRAVKENSVAGSMLAVGIGVHEIQEFLPPEPEQVCIACENSPNSITLSGEAQSISQLREILSSKGLFARELKTGRAYHSPHMQPVGEAYDAMLAQTATVLTENDALWRRERSPMISSVTGEPIVGESLPEGYWSMNLKQRVLFSTAVERMGSDKEFNEVAYALEVGPHAALSGPFKQICLANKFDRFTYISSMERNKDDANQLLSVAGSLFLAGYNVDLEEVNSTEETEMIRKPKTQYLLVDLPPYQWNYEKDYWAEPRGSAEQRSRAYPRHDLLGSRISGLSPGCKVWRNILRQRDVPWLKDHTLGGTAIFPAAGHMSLAIEALRQVHETEGIPFEGATLRDMNIKAALVIPDSNDGIEIVTRLETTDGSNWHSFSVESFVNDEWGLHCEGRISGTHKATITRKHPVDKSSLAQRVSGKRWYDAFHRVGFQYSRTFQQLQDARTIRNAHHAAGRVSIVERSGVMEGESRYLIHPSTVDACLQLIIISIHAGKHKEMPWGVVPTKIEEVSMFLPKDDCPSTGDAVAWTDRLAGRRFNTHAQLTGQTGKLLMNITNLTCVSYEAALPAGAQSITHPETFSVTTWKPDISSLTPGKLVETRGAGRVQLLDLVQHRQPVQKALIGGLPSSELVDSILEVLPTSCVVTIGLAGKQELDLSDGALARTRVEILQPSPAGWEDELGPASQNLVLVDFSSSHAEKSDISATKVMNLISDGGWLIGPSKHFFAIPGSVLKLGEDFACQKAEENKANSISSHENQITVFSTSRNMPCIDGVVEIFRSSGKEVHRKSITEFDANKDRNIVIDDTLGGLLLSMSKDEFEALKAIFSSCLSIVWLTRGVKEGQCPGGGMAEGFLRVMRSEQAAARVVLLDFSQCESLQNVAHAIMTKLSFAGTKSPNQDTEFWLHHGVLHVSRVYANKALNLEWDESVRSSKAQEKPLIENLPLKVKATDGEITFEPEPRPSALGEQDIEIQVDASELQLASNVGMLVAGTVIQAGASVDNNLIGEPVVAFVYDGFHTIARTSLYAAIDRLTAASLATLVGTLATLQPLAQAYLLGCRLERGDRIVCLPGQYPLTAITILLAQAAGCALTLVVASEEERQDFISQFSLNPDRVVLSSSLDCLISLMETNSGSSTLSVIAHDFSMFSQEVWRSIPASGKFILLSKDSLQQAPDLMPFTRGASFIPVNLETMHISHDLLRQSIDLVGSCPELLSGGDKFVKAIDAGSLATIELQNTKVPIVKPRYNESQLKVLPEFPHLSLRPDATYLLIGCLGGLGRSLTKWMIERGARYFAFLSRSGADKPEAAQVVRDIEEKGAQARVFRADVADEETVRRIVHTLNTERLICGVVHAAMVLKDGMFEQIDYASFMAAITPKAVGALSLHKALNGLDLDFFVMTSSISGILGNTGQSNYSAANSFLDALALHRNINHLAGTSLVLPMVLDVGVVAENDSIETSLMRKGLYGIDEHEMLHGFEVAMSVPCPAVRLRKDLSTIMKAMESQLIMGMEIQELSRSVSAIGTDNPDLYWYEDARFCHIRDALEVATQDTDGGGDENFAALLKVSRAKSPLAAVEAIATHIIKRMSTMLMIPIESFELDTTSLATYGLDSMIGAELRTWLFKEFGLDYPFQKLLAPTLTFKTLATVIAGKMDIVPLEDSIGSS